MNRNYRKLLCAFILLAFPGFLQAQNQPPTVTQGGISSIREMGLAPLSVFVTDPESDPLTYSWEITSDPTGQAFFRLAGGANGGTFLEGTTSPSLALPGGANYPSPSYSGQVIEVTAVVSDGVNSVPSVFSIPVQGVNLEPVIVVNTSQMGTLSQPRKPPEGIGLNAAESYDPDSPGQPVKMIWRIVSVSPQSCLNNDDVVLLGKETDNPGFVVPPNRGTLSNPSKVVLELVLEDGLIFKQIQYTGYMYDPVGCGGTANNAPVVSLSASTLHAAYSQTVTLNATVTDPGDTLTYTWLQLDTTSSANAVVLSNPTGKTTTFVAPGFDTFLRFRFTATDSVGQTASGTINVQVSQSGGGTSSPPPGGGIGSGTKAGTPSGTATGQVSCSGTGNVPARATVPATYTIEGGNLAQISATGGVDPDNTSVFVNGITVSGAVTYSWTVVSGGGFLTNGALAGSKTSTVSFGTPFAGGNGVVNVLVADGLGCGTSYNVNLVVQAVVSQNNNPPAARLQYSVEETSQSGEAPGSISLTPPATIQLNAGASTDPDGDSLTYSWNLQPSLTGVSLSSGTTSRTLTVQAGVTGTTTVSVTVNDGKGGSVTRSLTLQFVAPTDKPVQAVAAAWHDGSPLGGAVGTREVIVLSAAESDVVDGTPEEKANLTFVWEQISGPAAFARNVKQQDAEIMVRDLESISEFVFRLTVRNGTATDTDLVSVLVDPALTSPEGEGLGGDLYFARVGFGPAGTLEFQTVLVIDNVSPDPVEDVIIEFFASDGEPLDVRYLDTDAVEPELRPWNRDEPLTVEGYSSRALEFRALEDAPLTAGWARVTSSGLLRGSVRFQLLDDTGRFLSDVGILSSSPGSEFQAAFRAKDDLAFAISNPGDEPVRVSVGVADRMDSGFRVEKNIDLEPGAHVAEFLSNFFPFLSALLSEGTLELAVEDGATIIPTVLITREQLAVSAQSFARIR